MDMIVFLNVKPEDHDNFALALEKAFTDKEANAIVKAAEIQKQKKADYDKKRYEEKKNSTVKNVNSEKEKREEEREEKEAVSPLVPPSLSPDTPYPIPPIIPPSQEKEEREGERKERERAKSPKPLKTAYGMFGHVMLTGEEFRKLFQKFGKDCSERIQRLDDYLENNRKKHYDNHYLTILNWARRDEQTVQAKPQPKRTYTFAEVGEMERRGEL